MCQHGLDSACDAICTTTTCLMCFQACASESSHLACSNVPAHVLAAVLHAPVDAHAPPRIAGHLLASDPPLAEHPRWAEEAGGDVGGGGDDDMHKPERADMGDE
ncbi:unnamed protein product [Cyclocybe aegerita]|uniref:Uncharacterized protein n=1 Tax=Cyclocybe aegerita TaxID=1973307 RepID=A0A8S0W5S2_CYCAE|nr:unnamed protein product [Cyclocybe aegerita]